MSHPRSLFQIWWRMLPWFLCWVLLCQILDLFCWPWTKGCSRAHRSLSQHYCWKESSFLIELSWQPFKKDLLIKKKRTNFWDLFHCLYVCFHASLTQFGLLLFLLSVEIRKHESSGFVLLSQDCLGTGFLFCCSAVSLGFDVLSSHGHSPLTVFWFALWFILWDMAI